MRITLLDTYHHRFLAAHYSKLQFDLQDATALNYADNTFDIDISGCCLLHLPEYQAAIAETARVTSQYVVFHRTPVVMGQPKKYFRKQAYGVETVEIHFNQAELLQLLADNGLELLATYTLYETMSHRTGNAMRTYACRKKTV